MKQFANNTGVSILLFLVVTGFIYLLVATDPKPYQFVKQQEEFKAECANSGHTYQQCQDYWISSGEYKRPSALAESAEWKEFIKAK